MAANPFFSGRIPQGLLDAVEEYRQRTGESKTDVLIKALSALVDYQLSETDLPVRSQSTWLDEKFNTLEQRIDALSALEIEVAELKRQLTVMAFSPRIDNTPDNSDNNTEPDKKQLFLLDVHDTENSADVIKADEQDSGLVQEGKPDYLPEGEWEYLGEMQSTDILKLEELQTVDPRKLKNKVNNTNTAKNKQALMEPYFWKIDRQEPGGKGRLIYKVYRRMF